MSWTKGRKLQSTAGDLMPPTFAALVAVARFRSVGRVNALNWSSSIAVFIARCASTIFSRCRHASQNSTH